MTRTEVINRKADDDPRMGIDSARRHCAGARGERVTSWPPEKAHPQAERLEAGAAAGRLKIRGLRILSQRHRDFGDSYRKYRKR